MITWQKIDKTIGEDVLRETWTYTDSKYRKDKKNICPTSQEN